jgi:hypothetical protein
LDNAKASQQPDRVSKETQLDSLSLDLINIARTARRIERTESGFAAAYRLPENTSEKSLTTHTDGVLLRLEDQSTDSADAKTAKAALRAKFVAYELPADFVAHLRADRDAIADANATNRGEVLDGVKSTSLIGVLLGKLMEEIAELDAIMHNKYARQPEKLRAWLSASHVERAPKRNNKKDEPPTPPAPTPTA